MQRKKPAIIFLALLISLSLYKPVSADSTGLAAIMMNNTAVTLDTPAVSSGSTVMVPAEEFLKSLGGSFSYNSSTMKGTAQVGENQLVFNLDDSVACYDGKYVQSTAPMQILNNRFMVPAVFTATELGAMTFTDQSRNTLMVFQPVNGQVSYTVQKGDSLWLISQTFSTTISAIMQLNNLTSSTILIGQKLIVKNVTPASVSYPASTTASATLRSGPDFSFSSLAYLSPPTAITVLGKTGDWYKVNTPKGNGYIYYTVVKMDQTLAFGPQSSYFNSIIPVDTSADSVSYTSYTVAQGDYIWSLALKFGIPDYELEAANNLTPTSTLMPNQVIKVPVHSIAVKSTPGPQYGELLDWFKEAQYVFPIGTTGKLTDMETGKSFMVKRTMGASHSDTETLTTQDTQIMKDIFGGSWTWNKRTFLLEANGRRMAVAVEGMPHAGVDGVPFLQNVDNRSGGFGYGPNDDAISGNGMDGHFDLYFVNCRRHVDNNLDPIFQYTVQKAGGLH